MATEPTDKKLLCAFASIFQGNATIVVVLRQPPLTPCTRGAPVPSGPEQLPRQRASRLFHLQALLFQTNAEATEPWST
jgi:hypothetical protein